MGHLAKLHVFGQTWQIERVEIVYHRDTDPYSGKPTSQVNGGNLDITLRSSDRDDPLAWWMFYKNEKNREDYLLTEGRVDFYEDSYDAPVAFSYSFGDALVVYYREPLSCRDNTPMLLHIVISPAIQRYKGVLFVKPWHVRPLPPKEEPMPYQAVEDNATAKILELYWMDEYKEKRIDTANANQKVILIAKTVNMPAGEVVKIKMKRKDDKKINGKDHILYTGTVDENGLAEMKPVKLDKSLTDNNT